MQFISEDIIEAAVQNLESSEEILEVAIQDMQQKQPVLLGYFFSENFDAFTQAEKEYLLYLLIVIWKSVNEIVDTLPQIEEEQISALEEANWDTFLDSKSKDFRSRLDAFFENYLQEDLLAFVEDALVEDDEDEEAFITDEGRPALFISLKTVIDCLNQVG